MTHTLTKTVIFAAPPDLVWSYLTNQEKLGTWYHPAEADLAPGQPYRLMGTSDEGAPKAIITGDVLEWEPPLRLVTTFSIPPFGDATTKVTWDLTEMAGGTRLTMTHSGITEAAGEAVMSLMQALDVGWDGHLGDLRKACAA
ncbi:MAG: SRPBCC domain-containing protein [Pseudomonadota bacterium]